MTKIRLVVKEVLCKAQRSYLITTLQNLFNYHYNKCHSSAERVHSVNRIFRFVLQHPQVLSLNNRLATVAYKKLESLERYLQRKPMGRGMRTFQAQADAVRQLYATQKLIAPNT